MSEARPFDLTVLGVGNILWADEGFGVRCVEHFHRAFRPMPRSQVLDGGTLGMYLLDTFTSTKDLLIFDCADLKAAPGTMKVLRGDDIALWSATKLSAHQGGVNDVLVAAELLGKAPERVTVIGVQPAELNDYGGSLTGKLKAAIAPAIDAAVTELTDWGYSLTRREPGETVEPLGDRSLNEDVYENERPSEAEACREGDIRFAVPVKE